MTGIDIRRRFRPGETRTMRVCINDTATSAIRRLRSRRLTVTVVEEIEPTGTWQRIVNAGNGAEIKLSNEAQGCRTSGLPRLAKFVERRLGRASLTEPVLSLFERQPPGPFKFRRDIRDAADPRL